MDEYTQQLEMQLRFAEEKAQERERIAYKNGKDDGYNQALEDFVENISLPMTEEQIGEIVEKLKR